MRMHGGRYLRITLTKCPRQRLVTWRSRSPPCRRAAAVRSTVARTSFWAKVERRLILAGFSKLVSHHAVVHLKAQEPRPNELAHASLAIPGENGGGFIECVRPYTTDWQCY